MPAARAGLVYHGGIMSDAPPRMFCLQCDYPLDRLPSNRCPECGLEFDLEDPETFRVRLPQPLIVYRARNYMEAHYLVDVLTREGILSEVRDEMPGFSGVTSSTIRVAPEDAELAQAILQKTEMPAFDEAAGEAWRCPNCGEEVDGHFDVCWQCQTPRGGGGGEAEGTKGPRD